MTTALTISARETAELLGVGVSTIYDQVRRGLVPNVGLGASVRVPRVWVERRFAEAGAPLRSERDEMSEA